MKTVIALLLVAACCGLMYGQATKPAASNAAEAVRQLERDWSTAQKAVDIEKLSQILADDWMGLGSDGAQSNKKSYLNDVKTGANKLESFEIGPMDVKIIGNVAIVQGSDTEKSSNKGKSTSGKWVWMDVFENRNGNWVAVRSQSAMVK